MKTGSLRRILSYTYRYRWSFIISVLGFISFALADIAAVEWIRRIITYINSDNDSLNTILAMSLIFIAIIYGFSSIPILLNAPILFFNSIPLQGVILLSTSIFSLVCLGSGLKQVYMLRNIEAILLILFSGFSTLITL